MELTLDNWNATVISYKSTPVTKSEADLFDLIDTIRYGSVHDVELVDNKMVTSRNLTPRRLALVHFMREESPKIDEMVIHDGEVTYINIFGTAPYRYVRKIKF